MCGRRETMVGRIGPKAAGLSPHRLEALADGIFAIAMTPLVLELRVPDSTVRATW